MPLLVGVWEVEEAALTSQSALSSQEMDEVAASYVFFLLF
jgi:hypothetical protein